MGASTLEITKDSFKDQVQKEGIFMVDWWATWCGPCRAFAPTFERSAAKHPDIRFGKVNTEEEPELSAAFGIASIPTLMVFRDGILLFEQAGALPERALEDLIGKVQALDMEKVKAEVAAQEKKAATAPAA